MSAWWNIRLRAPFWAVVSIGLLVWAWLRAEEYDPKGDAVLIGVGGFGLLTSLAFIVFGRKRSDRDEGQH
ncbi:MAG: hypothetical protein QNJ98_17600 [Planctomycetota bacterium]|nr:hypothetical protein [Planctomycetota bacterium]